LRFPLALGAAASTVALIVAGCGSSSSSSSSNTTAAAAPATTTQSTPASATSTPGGTSTPAPGAGGAVLISTKHGKLGTILAAGPKQRTVYLFEADQGAKSACAGECTAVWPPVTTSGEAKSAGSAMAADIGTITRSDGTRQVTYKGHPLYFFARDGDKSDMYGQGVKGFGSSWYVLSPSGTKVDKS
jgi:predicted lipoprotein with Yx(FWY)xxD motif